MENSRNSKVKFLTVEEFKSEINAAGQTMQIVKSPKTGKLFFAIAGKNYRVQQDIDSTARMSILVPETGLDDACLVNVSGTDNVQFTL